MRLLDIVAGRFWRRVQKTDGCWSWPTLNRAGYGKVQVCGKLLLAHRVAWQLANDDAPLDPRAMVCHRCDNPACVRPDHLFVGDAAANAADRHSKGRSASRVGEDNGRARLTWQQVNTIRALAVSQDIAASELARRFGVSKGAITDIVSGRSWTGATQ